MAEEARTTEPPIEGEREPRKHSARYRLAVALQKAEFTVYTTVILALLLIGFLWPRMFISIPTGHRGVMYRYFRGGTVTDRIWGEGLNIIPPWDNITLYDIRLQQATLKFDVLSEEGLDLGVEVTVRFRPNAELLGHLHEDIGTNYFDRLVRPEVQSHVRRTFGNRPAHEIYTSAKDLVQELGQISVLAKPVKCLDGTSPCPYIYIEEMKLVDIELPAIVQQAIADKYKQEQLMLEYRYKLEREEKEAERKRTEAAGIRDYNLIASKVSADLLRWRSIDATAELAGSPNTKIVVLGGGQGSSQILMNVDGPSVSPSPSAAPAASAAPAPGAPLGQAGQGANAPRPPAAPIQANPAPPPPPPSP